MLTGSTIIALMLAVGGSRCVASQTPSGRNTYHCYYNTVLQTTCPSGASIPTELRVYSSKDGLVLPNNTVVFTYARTYIPPNGTALLKAIQVYPFSGDSSSENYDEHLPEIPPWLFAIGVVRSVRDVTTIDNNKRVTLEVSK